MVGHRQQGKYAVGASFLLRDISFDRITTGRRLPKAGNGESKESAHMGLGDGGEGFSLQKRWID
jgi:hypothetical protein